MGEAKGIEIKKEGSIEAAEIDKRMLVDRHYYSIASKATLKKPTELNIPKDKFKDFFGVDWDEAVEAGKVFNAKDACEKLQIDADKMNEMWGTAKKEKKLVKFGGGFYCASLPCGDDQIYAFNGFFMSMRSKFVAEGVSIYYYLVDWESSACAWEDFRGKVLGPTDPEAAPGDNGVHASASPFEALAERVNWLGYRADRDPFGKLMLKAGVSRSLIKDWSNDPQVTFGVLPMTKSIFDTLEDMDSDLCLAHCQLIASFAGEKKEAKKEGGSVKEVEVLKAKLSAYEELARAVAAIQAFKVPGNEDVKAKAKAKARSAAKAKPKAKTRVKKVKKETEASGDTVAVGQSEAPAGSDSKASADASAAPAVVEVPPPPVESA